MLVILGLKKELRIENGRRHRWRRRSEWKHEGYVKTLTVCVNKERPIHSSMVILSGAGNEIDDHREKLYCIRGEELSL
ncbi:hypothetical protein CEXT_775641 [Caerostris extrusa]|uniref:Uncharacterized protein n=1 Tax=Caerostris extrusa TaxID=172846 RepID=A0AAV4U389_CAEEX|nr:hypothetical protein CEXT_775641 [Caerostris extrusa]